MLDFLEKNMEGGRRKDGIAAYPVFQGSGGGEKLHESRGAAGDRAAAPEPSGLQGTLYIASVEGCGPRLFAEWIAGFQQRHPHVQYNLWNGNTDDVNNRVTKGLCEIAMITAPYNTEEFHVLPVYEEPWVAVIPKGHALYSWENDPVKPSELLPYDLLIPSRESRKGEIDKWFDGTGHAPVIRGRIAHMMNAYELSLHGVGISIYPASISSLIRDKDVCVRPVEHPNAHADYALIWNKNHTLSHVAEEFIKYVESIEERNSVE